MSRTEQMALNFAATPKVMPPADCPAEVLTLFESLTLKVIASGFSHYSADAILHRIRWEQHIERGNRDFTVNNNWAAPLARWFMAIHTIHAGFFELRRSKHDAKTGRS